MLVNASTRFHIFFALSSAILENNWVHFTSTLFGFTPLDFFNFNFTVNYLHKSHTGGISSGARKIYQLRTIKFSFLLLPFFNAL